MDAKQRKRLEQVYADMDSNRLLAAGRAHLEADIRPRLRHTRRWLRFTLWLLIVTALAGIGFGAIWLLLRAKSQSAEFVNRRDQRMSPYLHSEE